MLFIWNYDAFSLCVASDGMELVMQNNKVAILSNTDIRHITMICIYTDYFDMRNIPYEIICTNRYNDKDIKFGNTTVYLYPVKGHEACKIRKVVDNFKFRRFAINILKKNHYKYVVVWNEYTMVLFSDFLAEYGRYCVNIRDIYFPRIPFFWKRLTDSVKHSDFATWCAQRGKEYLPTHDYYIVLNQNKKLVEGANISGGFVKKGNTIHIGAIGYIRHIDESKRIMRVLCNDERYMLQFFGNGSENLLDYAKEIGMRNIEIIGTFRPEKTAELLDKIDVINALVGDGRLNIEESLGSPIRYGYSTLLYKPALVSPNTFLSERTTELNIAFVVDDFQYLADRFYDWYYSLEFDEFKDGCEIYNHDFDESIWQLHELCDKKIYPIIKGENNA